MKNIILVSLISAAVLSGCNTFKGLGEDISQAGEGVTDTAQKVDDKI